MACAGLLGCSLGEPAGLYLQRRAGLTVCPAVKIAEPTEARDTPDVAHFAFHLDGDCRDKFIRSVFASSRGECAEMLPKQHACLYDYKGGPSVIVERSVSGKDFKVTTY
jgi:hypothetical protein